MRRFLWIFLQLALISGKVSSLQVPSLFPSYEYLIPQRKIDIRPVAWRDEGEGLFLPLQTYHAKRSVVGFHHLPQLVGETDHPQVGAPLSLEAILENVDKYDLSHSSKTQLERHQSLPEQQRVQLLQKIRAEFRASQPVPLSALRILYCDAHICVVDKPSGVLSVPGPRRNPSLANVVYDVLRPDIDLDQMVVHRLDMATSGILVYALSLQALSQLHSDFKTRRVQKSYQALVHGHSIQVAEGEIDVHLERDINNPPFMRIAQPKEDHEERHSDNNDHDDDDNGSVMGKDHKFYRQAPKESLTTWSLNGYEYYNNIPVTRLDLRPWTGRTHQLRVHCAQALGYPIVGDDIYGGELQTNTAESSPLCLHARKLCIYHPISGAPMVFEADTPF